MFNVMPFGLCNAPATFQQLMGMVLAGIQWSSCLVYLNDTIVVGKTFEEHLRNLAQVFDQLRCAGLKLKPQKCAFGCQQVEFLGHLVSAQGVSTDPAKTAQVAKWPEPQSTQEVQQFLDLASYYCRFVKSFVDVASPLYSLLEKARPFHWAQACQEAFTELKTHLSTYFSFP